MNKIINIRVYGLLVNELNEILVSDERRHNINMTKFPGGGLNWGESPIECLKREFLEELNLSINVGELFYVSDFFLPSFFDSNTQIISMFFFVESGENIFIKTNNSIVYDDNIENHRWISLKTIKEEDFTFPFEKKVCNLLKLKYCYN